MSLYEFYKYTTIEEAVQLTPLRPGDEVELLRGIPNLEFVANDSGTGFDIAIADEPLATKGELGIVTKIKPDFRFVGTPGEQLGLYYSVTLSSGYEATRLTDEDLRKLSILERLARA